MSTHLIEKRQNYYFQNVSSKTKLELLWGGRRERSSSEIQFHTLLLEIRLVAGVRNRLGIISEACSFAFFLSCIAFDAAVCFQAGISLDFLKNRCASSHLVDWDSNTFFMLAMLRARMFFCDFLLLKARFWNDLFHVFADFLEFIALTIEL